MARTVALAFVLFVITAADAQATAFRVVVVPGLGLDDLPALADRGAIGLLVPGAGPETSAARARAALVRGKVTNSLRGLTTGPRLISFETSATIPDGPAIVIGLPGEATQSNNRRYPVAVIGGGFHGVLTSDSTRIPGLVSIVDIAPTALGREDGLGWQADDNAAATVQSLENRIVANNRTRVPVTILVVALVVLLTLLWPRAGLLGLGAGLAANLVLELAGVSGPWAVLPVFTVAIVGGGALLALMLRSNFGVGLFLAALLLAYLLALGTGPAVALSTFGAALNGRFYGVSNVLETMLLVPAFAGAAFLGRRCGPIAFGLVALIAFVAIAGNRFGADGGGAIVLAGGFALLGALLWEARGRVLIAAFVGAITLALGLIALDAATGASSHVTRALESGPGGLAADIRDRITLSVHRIVHKPSVAVVFGIGLVVLVVLTIHVLRSDRPLSQRALPLAFAGAIALSLLVNDSPNDVALIGSVGLLVCDLVMLRDRCAAAFCLRSPSASSWPGVAGRRLSRQRPRP
jgi:hypothetical protein